MPPRNAIVSPYKMPSAGVDYYHSLIDVPRDASPYMQNCYHRGGVTARKGMAKKTSTEVLSTYAINALHRFYYGVNSKQLLVASGTALKYYDDISAWVNINAGLTDGNTMSFTTWGPKGAVFCANGQNTPFKWDGAALTNLSAMPGNVRQFLPILDRLIWIDNDDPSFIRSTKPYDETQIESRANALMIPGAGRIEGIAYHGLQSDAGFNTKALIAKSDSMWLLTANNLTPTSIDARTDVLSDVIGCVAIRTIVSTPIGTIFLGTDNNVYLITISGELLPIGSIIRSTRSDVPMIEVIQASVNTKPFAVYHDGFYKLFYPSSGSTYNNRQVWLDITTFKKYRAGSEEFWGPWYGPMLGQNISHAVTQDGPGDDGSLVGGQANAATGSYVYTLDSSNADDGTAITMIHQTNYSDLGGGTYYKTIAGIDIEIASVDGTLTAAFYDTPGVTSTGQSVALTTASVYWDDAYWDEFYWSGAGEPARSQLIPTEKIIARYLSVGFTFTSSSEQFKLYSATALGQIRSRKPFIGATARL